METLNELVYVLAATACGMAIAFAIFCYNHSRENKKTVSKLFNDVYRYFGSNTNYSD
jgi:hypothetical protein